MYVFPSKAAFCLPGMVPGFWFLSIWAQNRKSDPWDPNFSHSQACFADNVRMLVNWFQIWNRKSNPNGP